MLNTMPEARLEDLPEVAQELVKAVNMGGGRWLKRTEIAANMSSDKPRLNAGEIAMLDMLASIGFIEAKVSDTRAPSGKRWEYRSKREES